MPATPAEIHAVDYRHLFPWVRLFRAFRIAFDVRKLLLAAAALLCLSGGDWLFGWLPFAPEETQEDTQLTLPARPWPWQQNLEGRDAEFGWTSYPLFQTVRLPQPAGKAGVAGLTGILSDPGGTLAKAFGNWSAVLRPFWSLVDPALSLLDMNKSWADAAWGWTRLLWALLVWGFFGGAITRMAAVEFARDERVGLWSALRYAAARLLSYFTAPLLPILALLVLWGLCALGGLIGRIPGIGETIVGLFWFVPLLLAFVMMLLVLGTAAGWPLMYATISVEGSDGFDGFSRSYSYVFSRPWRYLWYAVLAMLYGSVLIVFVSLAMSLIVYLAGWGIASGMGVEPVAGLHAEAPFRVAGAESSMPPIDPRLLQPAIQVDPSTGVEVKPSVPWNLILPTVQDTTNTASETPNVSPLARGAVTFWLSALALLLQGFVYSYFWTAWTILYFLLRRADDATETDEVYLPDEPERDELLPLVGAAASEQPVVERPVRPENPQAAEPPADDDPTA